MHRVMMLLTMVVVIAIIVPTFAQPNWCTSLHFTRTGKDYWYKSENGGFEKLSRVSIDQMYCTACHGPTDAAGNAYTKQNPYPGASCADCHPNSNPLEEKSVNQCLGCHGRQKTERIAMGYTDVHQDSACWFCHKDTDMHGTADQKFSILDPGAISVDCDSCHRETTPPSPWVRAQLPDHSQVDPHQGKLHCMACHAKSVVTCYNCHFESQVVNKKRAKGALHNFIILVNSEKHNKVYPATFQSITYQDTTFVAFAPYYPHTITEQGRACNDCHGNQYVQDWNNGNGEIKFATFDQGTQALTGKIGVIPLPPDYQKTFRMDYIDYTGDPNDGLPGTANWILIGKDIADLTQLLFAKPLTQDQMNSLATVVGSEED